MRALVLVAAIGSAARADPVNLLAHRSTTINVGSTVANRAIKPEHLVDGKLDTAWNSKTGDLVGAWLVVRLPADAKVQSIKLTAGFTKVDPKLGDLFTENPRIKKLRITHDKTVVEIVGTGGARMRIDVTGTSRVDVVGLAQAFWSRER